MMTAPPWPVEADGTGVSLELIAPQSNPDHSVASNWRASVPGGTPGSGDGVGGVDYAAWRASVFTAAELADATVSGDLADGEGDGMPVFMEFAVGGSPKNREFDLGIEISRVGGEERVSYARARNFSACRSR